ncbi:MAG: ribosome maturation factor RimM [Candidatus Dormibacteria bacterium]
MSIPVRTPATVRIGFVRKPVGLAGEVAVEPLTDDARRFRSGLQVVVAGTRRTVESVRGGDAGLRVRFSGVDDLPTAERLRNQYVEVDSAEVEPLEEGHYYHWQLIGLEVHDRRRGAIGIIEDILQLPANDVYVVRGSAGETLVPALRDVVREVDLQGQVMAVDIPDEEVVA